jgi:uncharacterized membrane protein YsdA (DUF1294 family)
MDPGAFDIKGEAQRAGERWLLICDMVGGLVGAVVAVAVLVVLVG